MDTPRINYLRQRSLGRTRNSRRFLAWLDREATRLLETTSETYERLRYGSAKAVEAVPTPTPPP